MRPARVAVGGGTVTFLDREAGDEAVLDIAPNGDRFLEIGASVRSSNLLYWSLAAGTLRPLNIWAEFGAGLSPDQRTLAISSSFKLRLLDLRSGRSLREIAARGQVRFPRWSPDGRLIRFDSYDLTTDTSSIWEASPNGGVPRPVFDESGSASDACCGQWTKDGRHFLFQARNENRTDLWISRQWGEHAVGAPVRLTNGSLDFRWPLAGPGSKTIFALGEKSRSELVKAGRNGAFTPFLPGVQATEVSFSRDGRRMAFVDLSDRTLWISAVDGTKRFRLTSPPLLAYQPQWSRDGKRIAFMGETERAKWAIYVVGAEGGLVYQPYPDAKDQGVPTFSPDGNSLVFGELLYRKDPTAMTIHLLDLNKRKLTTVPGSGSKWTPRWSPNGRLISAQSTDWHKLWLFDVSSHSWTILLDFFSIDNPTWSLDSSYVYFNGRAAAPDAISIFRIRVRDRKLETILRLGSRRKLEDNWCGVAPDGSPLFLRAVNHEEVYAIDVSLR